MNYLANATLAGMLLLTASVYAQDEQAEIDTSWKGTGELGFVSTSGNSKTETLNLKLGLVKNTQHWRHRFSAAALRSSKEGGKDAERYTAEIQSDRKLSEKSYIFGALRWDADKFGAYDPQQTVTIGYGRELAKSETHLLKGEVGAGYRKLEETETGISSGEMILRLLLEDSWQVFESTSWSNRLLIESGADNTFSQFNTGLSVAMNARFALKFGFEVRNNSKVSSADTKKTDTTTTMNLVYTF